MAMDVSNFLKWNDTTDSDSSKKRRSSSSFTSSKLSLVQENISHFFQHNTTSNETLTPSTPEQNHNDYGSSQSNYTYSEKRNSGSGLPAPPSSAPSGAPASNQFADKMVEKLFSMALPSTSELIDSKTLDKRKQMGKTRPSFSVPLMSKNFIQLNARLSVPFEFIDDIIRFFSWENPVKTVTILLFFTHLILTPIPVILSFPFFFVLAAIMIPNFSILHQPDNKDPILGPSNPILSESGYLKKPEYTKPCPEISREFIINLTDLQNHMLLYVDAWDLVNSAVKSFAYFNDEAISSFVFIIFLAIGSIIFFFGEMILMKFASCLKLSLIVLVWGFTITLHPKFHDYCYNLVYSEDTRLYLLRKRNKLETLVSTHVIRLDEIEGIEEIKEVEIFEIQQMDNSTKEWKFFCYLNDDFTKFSSMRINLHHLPSAIGSHSLKHIKPPNENWDFKDPTWKIDLDPLVYVSRNLLSDFVNTDVETKWIYDKLSDNETKSSDFVQFRRRRWIRSVTRHTEINKNGIPLEPSNGGEKAAKLVAC